jgi:hypothetical protein
MANVRDLISHNQTSSKTFKETITYTIPFNLQKQCASEEISVETTEELPVQAYTVTQIEF